jgi:DNA-binding transcriptional MerR regulator
MRPILLGEGRGRRTKFSIDDLLTLSLIKEINDFGIELNTLKKIMACLEHVEFPNYALNEAMKNDPFIQKHLKKPQFKGSIWDYYRSDRDYFKRLGYSLEISRGMKRKEIKELKEIGFISEKETKDLKQRWFKACAMDGKSQALLLAGAINPSEKKIEGTMSFPILVWQGKDVGIIVNLLRLIKGVENMTKRIV